MRRTLLMVALILAAYAPRARADVSLLRDGDFRDGTQEWTFSAAGGTHFELAPLPTEAGADRMLCYENQVEDLGADYSFYQAVHLKPNTYYHLSFRYRGDGKLAPMVLLHQPGEKNGDGKIFKLVPGTDWQTYDVDLNPGQKAGDFRLQFYPGSAPHFYFGDNGRPHGGRAGHFCFSAISLVETTRHDPPTPKGPHEIQSDSAVYKRIGTLNLRVLVDRPRGTARVPVMVMIHGGGWSNGTPEVMAANARFLAERGIATVRIQYRLIKDGGTFPKTIGDVMDAIAWVRASADKYHFDLRRFGLTGGSAGSHLAAIAAQRTPECNVFAGYCGLYDAFQVGEGHFARQSHFVGPSEPERKEASARFQIKTPPPATILFHGLADPTIDSDQAVRFAAALRERGATVELIVVPGGGHEVGNPVLVHQRLLGFLNQQWGLHMAL